MVLLSVIGRRRRLLAVIAQGLIGASALYIDWMWTVHLVRTNRGTDLPFVIGSTVVAALVAAQLITIWRTRRGIDPVFLVAVQLAVGQLTVWAEYVVTGLGVDPGSYGPVRWTSPFSVELPLLALALAAVGLGVQRSRRDAFGRLGLTRVSWWQALVAIAFAAFAPILNDAIYGATRALSPGVYASTIAVATAQGSTVPLALQLLFAVMAGVAEETLFRGALQPRAGIVGASLLFTSIHTQYGFTPLLLMVFLHGVGYGLLRRYINTTAAILAHTAYDVFAATGWLEGKALVIVLLLLVPLGWQALRVPSIKESVVGAWGPLLGGVLLVSSFWTASNGASFAGSAGLAAAAWLTFATHIALQLVGRRWVVAGLTAVIGLVIAAFGTIAEVWFPSNGLRLTESISSGLGLGAWVFWASRNALEDKEPIEVVQVHEP